MSAAFFIVLDREDPGFDTMVNGKFLSQDAGRLRKIARSLKIPAIEDFVSYSPEEARAMMEDLGSDPSEIEGAELPEDKWYAAQEGLDWVSKMREHIRATPSSVRNSKGVLADLEEYREVFEQAKAIGARWKLQVDF